MNAPVTPDELRQMLRMSAALFLHDRIYLPIFLRAEREVAEMEAELSAVERARAILRLDEDVRPDGPVT